MNRKFFEKIRELNPNHTNVGMTVLEGEHFGEKALVSNGVFVWESSDAGFFARHREAAGMAENGVVEIGGGNVFCEVLGQEKKLVICGGGHVSIPVIQMGRMIGCHVTVLEDRPKFADNARRAQASDVICEPFEEGLKKIEGDGDTFFIIVTRGHRYDQICLEAIAKKPHAYIGMIGSKRRVALVKSTIIEKGGDPEVIDQVYTPIGLSIGAETPEEIAIAILAEIIQVKNQKKRSGGYTKEMLRAILDENPTDAENVHDSRVLATIIERKGSAPRSVGTKMLILPDGSCIGTIGGGCVEADILQRALLMLRNEETQPKLCHVDMTGDDAEDEGMVCGGVIDVLLEIV